MNNLKTKTIKDLEEWKQAKITIIQFRIGKIERYIESSNNLLDRIEEGTKDYIDTQKRIDTQWKEHRELKRLEKHIKKLRIIGAI